MRITQLIAYSRIISIYKKGKFISPFYIFISLLISISYTQFLPSNWSHPNISSINGPINGYATFQTIDDITYISDNDSTKIYNITNQFFSELNISKDLTLDIELMQRINKFKASYDLLLIDIKQKSKNINSKLKYHKLKKLTPSLLININNHALLLGGNLKFDFSQDIQIEVEKKSTEQLISTHLFYDDYQFILNNRKRRGKFPSWHILGYRL